MFKSMWCGPKINVPSFSDARSTLRRSFRSLSERDYGRRFANTLRRSSRSLSFRRSFRNAPNISFSNRASFRRRTGSFRRKEGSIKRKRPASEIKIIRSSYCKAAFSEGSSNSNSSSGEGISEEIELDEMTKQADNLKREYEQVRFQEKWRDDMLFKMHQEKLSQAEQELIERERSFSGVKRRADSLLDQIRVLIRKFLVLSQGDPGLVEACFHIIEEEERRDEEAAKRLQEDGFEIPDRPKKWKKKCLTELRKIPLLRVENTPQQDRTEDRNWLAKHLELMSQNLKEDLRIVKGLFEACQSLDKDIALFFIESYYECLAQHLQDIVSPGLRHNEIIQLLVWLTEHKKDMARYNQSCFTDVRLDQAATDLLADHARKDLEESYMKTVQSNMRSWAEGALQKEMEDWKSDVSPKADKDGYLYTEFPVHMFDLLRQNLEVAKEISSSVHNSLRGYCLDEVRNIVSHYAAAVKAFIPARPVSISPPSSPTAPPKSPSKLQTAKNSTLVKKIRKSVEPHLQLPSTDEKKAQANKPKFFVQYAVAALNNFDTIINHSQLFKQKLPVEEEKPKEAKFEDEEEDDFTYSLKIMRRLAKECMDRFLSDLFAELKPLLKQVATKSWFAHNGTSCIGDVCDTVSAYSIQMRRKFFDTWQEKVEGFILVEYTNGFVRKGACLTCKNSKDRQEVAEQICWESDQIENTIASLSTTDKAVRFSPFGILRQMAEVINLTDKSTIVLEVSSLVMKHPELTRRQLKAILRMRGDLKRPKIKKILDSSLAADDTDSIGYCSGDSVSPNGVPETN